LARLTPRNSSLDDKTVPQSFDILGRDHTFVENRQGRTRERMGGRPAILLLLFLNVVVFLGQTILGDQLIYAFALWPFGPDFQLWQVVTYAFLHGNVMHIVFNMFGLMMFGSELERIWGSGRFLRYYLVAVISAAMTQLVFTLVTDSYVPTVGASGGVFGLVLAYAMLFPDRRVLLLIPPIPMSARTFAIGYALLELVLGVTQTAQGIAHFAHLGGMLGGYLYLVAMRR
jgi:membrane associated rhomboid family serine protease